MILGLLLGLIYMYIKPKAYYSNLLVSPSNDQEKVNRIYNNYFLHNNRNTITWFSLAIAGLGMTYYTLKRPTRLKKINKKLINIYTMYIINIQRKF